MPKKIFAAGCFSIGTKPGGPVGRQTTGNTVSNLSSSRALGDITEKHGQTYTAAAVGEVNVVAKMKETNAVI